VPKKLKKLLRRLAPLTFLIRVRAFQDPLRRELPHVQIFMNDGPNPLTWDARLLSYWFSWNPAVFQHKLVNLISNLWGGHCLGRPGWGTSQVKNHHIFNWATQFLMVAYNGACSPNVSFRMVWISFGALPCRRNKTWWQLVSHFCWNCACRLTCLLSTSVTRKDLKIWHINRLLFPTTLLIPMTSGSRSY